VSCAISTKAYFKMKNLIQIVITILFIQTSYSQSTSCDTLLKNIDGINGEWIWVKSYGPWATRTPESDRIQKKIVIKEYKKIEIYINEKLEQTYDVKFINIVDKTLTRGSVVIWTHYSFDYVLDNFVQKKTKLFFSDHGKFELWNNEFLDISYYWCFDCMTEEFKKEK
jgi:hypothetical protein